MNIRKIFSERLQEAVKISPLSYAELAKKLGITKATMSMYKNGKAVPSLETFDRLCDYLDVSADYLLGKKEF
ncbi:MAG: helix-turn-helix transcriptional regulator [Clostridia bacterium]|nr:helix-turn-helix transcriptional regulator [Clostridia bacterium]